MDDRVWRPDDIQSEKTKFLLFDFFGNYDYFEKDFNYDEVLKLPKKSGNWNCDPPVNIDKVESLIEDPLAELKEILISDEGWRLIEIFMVRLRKK